MAGESLTKQNFSQTVESPLDTRFIEEAVTNAYQPIALLSDQLFISGNPEINGVVVRNGHNGPVVAALRSPQLTQNENGEFGAYPGAGNIEILTAIKLPPSESSNLATRTHNDVLAKGIHSEYFPTFGAEDEQFYMDERANPITLPKAIQIELQDCMLETPMSPTTSFSELMKGYALSRLGVMLRHGNIFISTSFYPGATPSDMRINSGEYQNYVQAVGKKMFDKHMFPAQNDKHTISYWNYIAQQHGYSDFYHMKSKIGHPAFLSFAASHISIGVNYLERPDGFVADQQSLIDFADLVNSGIGSIYENMTAGNPLSYSNLSKVNVDGAMVQVRDTRMLARLITATAREVSEHTYTSTSYYQKLANRIVNGLSDRVDRIYGGAHGKLRIRSTTNINPDGKIDISNPIARVEYTGGSNTSDLTAIGSRNSILVTTRLLSNYARSRGEHPLKFFAPHIHNSVIEPDYHMNVMKAYNFNGGDELSLDRSFEANLELLKLASNLFAESPGILDMIKLSRIGLQRIKETVPPHVSTLEQYADCLIGNISDVIIRMVEDGTDIIDVIMEIHKFEQRQAEELANKYDGNVLAMLEDARSKYSEYQFNIDNYI